MEGPKPGRTGSGVRSARHALPLRRAVSLWFGLVWLALGALGEEPQVFSFTCQFEPPRLEPAGEYTRVAVAGCAPLNRLGEPALPFRTVRLLLPAGCTVSNVQATPTAAPAWLEGRWRVEYAGQPHFRPGRGKGMVTAERNRHLYDSEALYPASAAELISVQRLAGFDIALVRVFPCRYRPAESHLEFTRELKLELTLAAATTNAEPPLRPPNLSQARARVAAFVDNPSFLSSLERRPSQAAGAGGTGFDYLLVTSSNLAAAFQPLVDRKSQAGLSVKVATLEAITNSVAGRDAPEQIRNYIRQAYTNWGIRYVLLGGATSVLPCRYAYVRAGLVAKDSYLPCDLYYGCLDGSWNANGDRHWGEPEDGENGGDVDLLAEVYVGRAPVATVAQVNTFVEKVVRYETEGHGQPTNALLMATFLGEFPTGPCQGASMYEPLLPWLSQCQVSWLDDGWQKYPQWSRTEALAALNRSPHVVLYNGHGDADVLMRMRTPDLARLTNQWPFLAWSVGCSAGQFDHGKFWPDSFGEALVTGSRHGAFAAVMNARAGWFDPQYPWKYSGEFQARFFEELLRRGHLCLGQAHQLSKEDLIGQVETSGIMTYRWCYYGITLLGDPHLAFQLPAQDRTVLSLASAEERGSAGQETPPPAAPAHPDKSTNTAGRAEP